MQTVSIHDKLKATPNMQPSETEKKFVKKKFLWGERKFSNKILF